MNFNPYQNNSAGIAALGPVQAMSDRNEAQTYMANGGQMFASGGIARLAEGGALPKYKYDPATQTYVLDTADKADTAMEEELRRQQRAAQASGGSGFAKAEPSAWDKMSLDQKAAYFAENPKMGAVSRFGLNVLDKTLLGAAIKAYDPIKWGEELYATRGIGLGPNGYMAQQNAQVERNAQQPDFNPVWGGGLRDTLGDQPGDYDGQGGGGGGGYDHGGPGPAGSGSTGGGLGGVGGSGTEGANGPGDGTAADYARGGLAALARGGMSHLGDYSDGGRLLRGPGDGVSDSIPATIGDKRPARLADGEFVVPARIVSELGNGSTEAGARKLYAMMDRIQKARKKSIGKNRVAVNSRAEKNLPA
jgi:hypothetical protein